MQLSSLSIKKEELVFFCFRVVLTAYRVLLINKVKSWIILFFCLQKLLFVLISKVVGVLETRIMSTTANFGFGMRSKSCQHLFVVAMMLRLRAKTRKQKGTRMVALPRTSTWIKMTR